MKNLVYIIIQIVACYSQIQIDDILKAVKENEVNRFYKGGYNPFDILYLIKEKDIKSNDTNFEFCPDDDTLYVVDVVSIVGQLKYYIWNKRDSIIGSSSNKYIDKCISLGKEHRIAIENWDTCMLKNRIHDKSRVGGDRYYYTSRVIITEGRYDIETIEYEYYYR